ncbi:MAG: hypothetical protein EBQ92_00985 [Proteobacteria bacterium]|nr:hypothetical protein [Pseudomonadota bacterium]
MAKINRTKPKFPPSSPFDEDPVFIFTANKNFIRKLMKNLSNAHKELRSLASKKYPTVIMMLTEENALMECRPIYIAAIRDTISSIFDESIEYLISHIKYNNMKGDNVDSFVDYLTKLREDPDIRFEQMIPTCIHCKISPPNRDKLCDCYELGKDSICGLIMMTPSGFPLYHLHICYYK